MNAKETIKYLYENGHIVDREHYKTIYGELTENKTLKELLNVAICPNTTTGCKDGILINPHGELGVTDKCQWCDMTKQALKYD